ncbi:CBO0543 family protein [Virgibacillus natechei]|uniref:CBO0543 family protein n=1 Tax=Virgibacillus sp. CBA3643 TaxID=2942278 RepID=UPI0035A31CC6
MERLMLKGLLAACVGILPFIFKFKKGPLPILIIAFLFKAFVASLTDSYVVESKRISYPARFLPKKFKLNILYDYLMYPIIGVIYTRMTYTSSPVMILLKTLGFSIPMAIGQWFLEKRTKLVKYNHWNLGHSFAALTGTLLFERSFIGLVKKVTKGGQRDTDS